MDDTLILINILYNPACYSHPSWLESLVPEHPAPHQLPKVAINHLLIKHYCTTMPKLRSKAVLPAGWLILRHWQQLRDVAWLLGLKSAAASMMHSPHVLQQLSPRQLQFFSCPVWLPCFPATETNSMQLLSYGAQLLFNAATELLPTGCLDRLRLIFPQQLAYHEPTDYPTSPLAFAAVQQAIHHV